MRLFYTIDLSLNPMHGKNLQTYWYLESMPFIYFTITNIQNSPHSSLYK